MMIPASAMNPSIATNPNGAPVTSSAADTPISPSGAVKITIAMRLKLCICSISSDSMTSTISGITALTEACPLPASSDAPAVSMA